MDNIRALEREIDQLQNRLRHQNEEAARERNKMLEQNRRSLEKYRLDMQRTIQQHDNDTRYEYEQLLSQYQHNLSNQVQSELAAVNTDYQRLMQDVKRSEAELLKKNKELEKAISELKNDISKREEGSSREASDCQMNAVEVYRDIEKKPHEKFAPNRLKIFYNSIRESQKLFKAGLFEASAAVAVSAASGLKRLGFTIDDKQSEWIEQYELFVMRLDLLESNLKQSIADWRAVAGQQISDNVCRIELDFWTRGDFNKISTGVEKYLRITEEVKHIGMAEYFKHSEGATTNQLREYIEDIQTLDKMLSSSDIIAKSRYTASCERSEWGEALIDFMQDEINLTLHEKLTGFKAASGEVLQSESFTAYAVSQFGNSSISEDMREWLRLVFENASGELIYIYILPIEADDTVTNSIVIHIDYHGAEEPQYSKDIYAHVCEAVNYNEDSTGAVSYASDINELKFSSKKAFSQAALDIERIKQGYTNKSN